MKRTAIDGTDVSVSAIAFGTARLHHTLSSVERVRLLQCAASCGITHFDTAPYYGFGLAESDLGEISRERRGEVTIATKVGLYPPGVPSRGALNVWARKALGRIATRLSRPEVDWSVQRASESLEQSLRRLRTDYVDFLFLHEPRPGILDADEFLRWIEVESAGGKVRAWGVAGMPGELVPWIRSAHPIARVVQCKDSLQTHEADVVLDLGRPLQFTYGYLSGGGGALRGTGAVQVVKGALERNATGAIVLSTRRKERIVEFAKAAG